MSRVGLQADEAERGDGGVCEFGLIRGCQTRLVSATRKFACPSIGRINRRRNESRRHTSYSATVALRRVAMDPREQRVGDVRALSLDTNTP